MAKPRIIIVHETVLASWAKDAGSFATFVGLIGLGWLIDSGAMQVVGAGLGMILLLGKSLRSKGHLDEMTYDQAAELIEELRRPSTPEARNG
jgi:uncharacterized membrane protein